MTSPALLPLSLDADVISGAFTATTAAEAVILAALGITSRFVYADQRGPTRREWVTRRCSLPARTCPGFPPTGQALETLRGPGNPPRRHDRPEARCRADPPDGKPVTT